MRTYESFFSFELCKPSGNGRPPSSPTPGLGFAKLQERLGEINPTQHPRPLGKVIPLKMEPIILPRFGLPLQTTPLRVWLFFFFFWQAVPRGRTHLRTIPCGRETSPRKAFRRADAPQGLVQKSRCNFFNFQMRPCCLSTPRALPHAPQLRPTQPQIAARPEQFRRTLGERGRKPGIPLKKGIGDGERCD